MDKTLDRIKAIALYELQVTFFSTMLKTGRTRREGGQSINRADRV